MDDSRLIECLTADAARLRAVAAADLAPTVPSCPEWSVADLVEHVAMVYAHKVECMRRGEFPSPWPPADHPPAGGPLALFDRGLAGLLAEFAARAPESPAATWYPPEQTVRFWMRRMAQETVIHRVDAELAAGAESAPIPVDLATDGIDEVLRLFLSYGSREYPEDFGDRLAECAGQSVLVSVGGARWLAVLDPSGVRIEPGGAVQPTAQVSGEPEAVLRWLWRRAGDERVRFDGNRAALARLRELLRAATQ
ncbi:maleylpyruvate isomerase family mycothiol-dependent enzyme [Rhizomonospora bruguierae]|uniref:maleylpyruvate isomerase family mycothiol-dependent enzyme n=1 Tax=Rhizomonospora bruguierae TaxID=1581705 RepID=UPI001BCF6C0F|nr:maleylpyruvate isomerase family mycothiol-dependent enzyme [Micromonospora sp. NBRC 107566]